MDISNRKIIVTRHAKARFTQRFRLYLPKYAGDIDGYIFTLVQKSTQCIRWLQIPFHVNRLCVKHNTNILQVFRYNNMFFVCKMDRNCIIVLTVMASWHLEELN